MSLFPFSCFSYFLFVLGFLAVFSRCSCFSICPNWSFLSSLYIKVYRFSPDIEIPSHFFFFLNCILLIILLHLSQFFHLCPPPSSTSHSRRQSPHQFPHQCSCPWVMCRFFDYSISYTVLHIPMATLYCLFVLCHPLSSSPILPQLPPIWQPSKHCLYP